MIELEQFCITHRFLVWTVEPDEPETVRYRQLSVYLLCARRVINEGCVGMLVCY
jgi:hypothetical protein